MPLDVGLEIQRRRAELGAYNRWIVEELDPYVGARVLDVGCGTGNILEFFLDRDLVVGIDIGPEFVDKARDRFGDRLNFRAQVGDISDPGIVAALSGDPFDSIICVNVLEHIEDDVSALSHMAQLLIPGGRVVLFVPALRFLHGTMDEVDGHYRRYTKRTLRAGFAHAGLDLEEVHYMNLPGMVAWFIDGRILRRRFVPASHDGAFQKLVPRIAAVERKVRPPVGLSLLAVGRRGV
jgi:SAM-dependent methyltransferase